MPDSGQVAKVFAGAVKILVDGESFVFDARGMARLSIITDEDATATVSRVDDSDSNAPTEGAKNAFTVAADSKQVTDVDWPFYFVSVADGDCRVALV